MIAVVHRPPKKDIFMALLEIITGVSKDKKICSFLGILKVIKFNINIIDYKQSMPKNIYIWKFS